ncbi:hypothetical protein GS854_01600 [Rhodococcus hoagii]|nr:hypothetical protein [Prescottella equi]
MADQFFITRAEMQALASLLREIPELIADLAITLTRQDNVAGGSVRIASGSDEQPLPINLAASDAHDLLRSTLAAWVRHVTETRGVTYGGLRGTAGIATWLADHVTSLAMTEGCEEAYDEIAYAMGECRRTCDRPKDRAVLPTDPHSEAIVFGLELSAKECADLARTSGVDGLTKRRVLYLVEVGAVQPLRTVTVRGSESPVLRMGEVLAAHHQQSTCEIA